MKIWIILILIVLLISTAVIGLENYEIDINGNYCATLNENGMCFSDKNYVLKSQPVCEAIPNEVKINEE